MKKGIILSLLLLVITAYGCGGRSGDAVGYETEPIEDLHHVIPGDGSKSSSPYFFVKSNYPTRATLFLKSTKAEATITGSIAKVKVQQVYVNTSRRKYDAIYIFPGSTRAAVYGLDMTVGDRVIHAQVKEREEARQEFEEARTKGKTATLLEQDRPNVFKMEVANIRPGDTIKVDMFYTELLEYREGMYEFVYPTAVGPRYSNQEEGFVTMSIAQHIFQQKSTFNVDITIDNPLPIQAMAASHEISVDKETDNRTKITLNNSKGEELGSDFILKYGLQGGVVESGLTLYDHGDEKFFLMMMQPPKQVSDSEILPREYIFIVDVSGSMEGFPLEISKNILRRLVSSLKPADRFNVLLFESSNAMLYKTSVPATKENIEKAIHVIDNQSGGGGTELYPALKKAFTYKDPSLKNYARTFIIATDGFVTIESKAFQLIADNVDKANFFPLGIGESVNRYLIEGMAWAGASEPFIIENETEAEKVGDRLIKMISQPLLTDINIDWGDFEVYDTYPQKIPTVFTERPIIVFGKYKGNPTGNVTLLGKTSKGEYQKNMPANTFVQSKNEALRYLWARNKIRYLSDYAPCFEENEVYYGPGYISDKNKEEVTQLGLKYNLLTAYTSFLAVDNDYKEEVYDENVDCCKSRSSYAGNYSMVPPPPMLKSSIKFEAPDIVACEDIVACDEIIEEVVVSQKVFDFVEQMPSYPGGDKEMQKFILENLVYPADKDIEGKVFLKFIIDENGEIQDITVLRSLDPEFDAEAIRLVKSMPKWNPGKQNGEFVAVKFALPIAFKL